MFLGRCHQQQCHLHAAHFTNYSYSIPLKSWTNWILPPCHHCYWLLKSKLWALWKSMGDLQQFWHTAPKDCNMSCFNMFQHVSTSSRKACRSLAFRKRYSSTSTKGILLQASRTTNWWEMKLPQWPFALDSSSHECRCLLSYPSRTLLFGTLQIMSNVHIAYQNLCPKQVPHLTCLRHMWRDIDFG